MSDAFERFVTATLGKEGGYVNHPSDNGKETNWGITVATARAAGYRGEMRDMTRQQAIDIYYDRFFKKPGLPAIASISVSLADILFDLGVHFGPSAPISFMQRALNVLNERGKSWNDIDRDGNAGPATRDAIRALMRRRGTEGERVLVDMIRAQASVRYIELAERDVKQEDFMFGWQRVRGTK